MLRRLSKTVWHTSRFCFGLNPSARQLCEKIEDEIKRDEGLTRTLGSLSLHDLRTMWLRVDKARSGKLNKTDLEKVARQMIRTQKERLRAIIREREDHKEELEDGYISWAPRWKQWGLDLQIEESATELEMAKQLHDALDPEGDHAHLILKVNELILRI